MREHGRFRGAGSRACRRADSSASAGRREFLGYEGHLWSQGLDYRGRKPVADAVFQGIAPPSSAVRFIRIDALAITPAEAALVGPLATAGLPSIVDSPYRLLKIR